MRGWVINAQVLMSQQKQPMGVRLSPSTWPFSLASLNKERQGSPAARTDLELSVSSPFLLLSKIIERSQIAVSSMRSKVYRAKIGFLVTLHELHFWPAAYKGSPILGRQNIVRASVIKPQNFPLPVTCSVFTHGYGLHLSHPSWSF